LLGFEACIGDSFSSSNDTPWPAGEKKTASFSLVFSTASPCFSHALTHSRNSADTRLSLRFAGQLQSWNCGLCNQTSLSAVYKVNRDQPEQSLGINNSPIRNKTDSTSRLASQHHRRADGGHTRRSESWHASI
jgi:hypothetical protein